MEDGKLPMPWAIKDQISHEMIHTPKFTIRGGEIIQISNGKSHN